MTKVLTVGVFDWFHYGHLLLFRRAKKYGDYLIVAVQEGDFILKYKPNTNILYSTEQRIDMIKALSIVDEVITYTDIDELVKRVDFDVFVKGEDQAHQGFQRATDFCKENHKEVEVLTRTPGISSSDLKKKMDEE